jgi:hypothetical protein
MIARTGFLKKKKSFCCPLHKLTIRYIIIIYLSWSWAACYVWYVKYKKMTNVPLCYFNAVPVLEQAEKKNPFYVNTALILRILSFLKTVAIFD